MKKKLESLNAKKLKYGSLKDIIGSGPKQIDQSTGTCGGTGTSNDPIQIETVTIIKSGGSQFDGCD